MPSTRRKVDESSPAKTEKRVLRSSKRVKHPTEPSSTSTPIHVLPIPLRRAIGPLLACPFAGLAVETLMHIFAYLPLLCPPSPLPPAESQRTWLAVTQVCRHWRRSAFACRELWAQIPLHSTRWAAFALEQSRPVPISVRVPEWTPHIRKGALAALREMPRMRELMLDVSTGGVGREDAGTIQVALGVPAPELVELAIARTGRETYLASLLSDSGMLKGATPEKLRRLVVSGVPTRFDSPLLRAPLTHLELVGCAFAQNSMTQLLNQLALMPHLETLILSKTLPLTTAVDAGSVTTRVPLLHLKSLSLQGYIAQIAALMEHVTVPTSAALSWECWYQPRNHSLDEFGALISSTLKTHFADAHTAGLSFEEFSIKGAEPVDITVVASQSSGSSSSWGDQPALPSEVKIVLFAASMGETGEAEYAKRFLMEMTRSLPLSRAESLYAQPGIFLDKQVWRDVYGAPGVFAHVQRVRTGCVAGNGLAHVLYLPHPTPLFPAVHDIQIDLKGLYLTDPTIAERFTVFMRVMEQRDVSHTFRLTITECEVSESTLAMVRARFGDDAIKWDGRYHGVTPGLPNSCLE
ncbi:hypothetical protein FA95DRAFT_1605865 [Auriscalpium vulgare]|uniref:Uncharacterized protein n=1 Tax=Auriscalpium vulgare TaxID=40419 RepID=A0ACB8RVB7_9AGAM|nr:hypothetical protein FA95DRAFT_1605865 [Auriscalpium vulgare]